VDPRQTGGFFFLRPDRHLQAAFLLPTGTGMRIFFFSPGKGPPLLEEKEGPPSFFISSFLF